MTEQELREKIAQICYHGEPSPEGDISWKGCKKDFPNLTRTMYSMTDQILFLIKEANYVKLADDQSLPKSWISYSESFEDKVLSAHYKQAQEVMLKASFRKVELND